MRLYLNCFEEYPYLWSIDDGTIETEKKYKNVQLIGAYGNTMYDLNAPEGHPKCWISIEATLDEHSDGTVRLYAL